MKITKERMDKLKISGRELGLSNTTHGMSGTPFWKAWSAMKNRCYAKKSKLYHNYGGRGISVCDEWLQSFNNFYKDMYPSYKQGLTLDRIDTDGNYEPSNCRWATTSQQMRNTRANVWIEYGGRKLVLNDWAKELHINIQTLSERVKRGWSGEKIVTTPPGKNGPRRKKQTMAYIEVKNIDRVKLEAEKKNETNQKNK